MEFDYIKKTAEQWKRLTAKAKNTEHILYLELLKAFKDTHKSFCSLNGMDLIPREACQVIMLMDEFTYYATMMDENYLGDVCAGIYYLNYALKNKFFKGKYQSEFFLGPQPSKIEQYVLDIENISLEDFIRFLKDEIAENYNDVVLANNS